MESQVQVLLDMLAMPTYFIPTLSVSQFGHRTYSAMTTFGQDTAGLNVDLGLFFELAELMVGMS